MSIEARQMFNFIQGSDITGESSYDIWKRLGNTGSEADFLEFIRSGPKGEKGDPAHSYGLIVSDSVIKKGATNTLLPTSITFSAYYRIGTEATRYDYSGKFEIQETTDGTSYEPKYTSQADEVSVIYTPSSADVKFIKCTLYSADNVVIDTQSVPIISEVSADDLKVLSGVLTNDAHVVPSDAKGENCDFSECRTSIQVFSSVDDVTEYSTYEVVTSEGLNGNWDLANHTYNVTELTVDTGYVDIFATYKDITIVKRFSISKSKAGKSSYEIWLEIEGNEGKTEEEFINQNTNTYIDEEITVELGTNGTVGGFKTGDKIEAGTDLQTVLNKLFQKAIPPTYTAPKVAVSAKSTAAGSYEYGTNITAQVQATFTQNDAGTLESISILKDGVEIKSGSESPLSSDSEEIQLLTTVAYKATASYAEGGIKKNNIGEDWSEGHIEAGSVASSELKFTPYRQGYFYGILDTDSSVALTSDIIRSGTKKNGSYAAGNLPLIEAASVANRKRIFVACPATNKGVTKVIMPSAMQSDCTNDFVKQATTVTVEGANGSTGIAYNVWVYEPASISDDQTFTVTLG